MDDAAFYRGGDLCGCTGREMNAFINNLMSKMTPQEKIGQLNLPWSGDIVTGQAKSSDIWTENPRWKGWSALFGHKSQKIRDVQRVAVEESRLKIPLIFGMNGMYMVTKLFSRFRSA